MMIKLLNNFIINHLRENSGRQEGKEKSDVKPALGGDDGQCGVESLQGGKLHEESSFC